MIVVCTNRRGVRENLLLGFNLHFGFFILSNLIYHILPKSRPSRSRCCQSAPPRTSCRSSPAQQLQQSLSLQSQQASQV